MTQINSQLDDELAQATDALLEGREMGAFSPDNADLISVVRDLVMVIDPNTPPSAVFQQRLTARLNAEWDRANSPPTLRLLERPVVRLASLAAAVVLVLGALVVLAVPETSPALQGAALPLDDVAAILVLVGVAVVGAFAYWRSRH